MKKIISIIILLFALFNIQQNFTMNEEQAFEECIAKCEDKRISFIKGYQNKCRVGLLNRSICLAYGFEAVRKFHDCSNECFKKFDEANKQ